MKNMKFRIKNKRHSSAIQNELFRIGYTWHQYSKGTKHTERPWIFTYVDGDLAYSQVEDSIGDHTETTLDELYDMEKEPEKVEWYRVTAFAEIDSRPEVHYQLYRSKEEFIDDQETEFKWIKLEKFEVENE